MEENFMMKMKMVVVIIMIIKMTAIMIMIIMMKSNVEESEHYWIGPWQQ